MTDNASGGARYWTALNSIKGVGSRTASRLLERFKRPERIFSASVSDFEGIKGLREETVEAILRFSAWKQIDEEIEKNRKLGIAVVTWEDACYPVNLLNIHDPPIVLYVSGEITAADCFSLGIVGSRSASAYGIRMAEDFAHRLGEEGVTIVSGFARGVDTAAHKGAVAAGGRTIAVLGCGLDVIYPPENRRLAREIIAAGAMVSEFPLGTNPDAVNFPKRNRIISGLSLGVLVVEASAKSGSLITAGCALEQGREVYAIPGNADALQSRGTNSLIRQGARLVERPDEILSELLPHRVVKREVRKKRPAVDSSQLNELEEMILARLESGPLHIDLVTERCARSAAEISAVLLNMELKGLIRQNPGKLFSKV